MSLVNDPQIHEKSNTKNKVREEKKLLWNQGYFDVFTSKRRRDNKFVMS